MKGQVAQWRKNFLFSSGEIRISVDTHPTEPEVTRKGNGVGHWLCGELAKELLVLETWLWGHCGGPTAIAPGPLFRGQQSIQVPPPFSMAAETRQSHKVSTRSPQLLKAKTGLGTLPLTTKKLNESSFKLKVWIISKKQNDQLNKYVGWMRC